MWFGQARLFNTTVAVVAALAWFTGTHHCLLGIVKGPQSRAVSTCHCSETSKGSAASNEIPSRMLTCCQGLLSPGCGLAYVKSKFKPVLIGIDLMAVGHLVLVRSPHRSLLSTEYDTGPPVGNIFVETVLKRSLRENAPPLTT